MTTNVSLTGGKTMRLITRLLIAYLMVLVVLIGSVSRSSANGTILRARATVNGAAGSGISGEVLFFQARTGVPAEVLIIARVEGLEPNTVHGFHIHENGTCSPDFAAAGGHYDPGPFGMSNPDANHPFHMGDMPNLRADSMGVATFEHVTSRVTIAPGPLSLFDANGSSVIVHLNEDQGTTGVPGGSGGPRIACGVIELIP
jgi:Cu-Zn family superoxide dismutase